MAVHTPVRPIVVAPCSPVADTPLRKSRLGDSLERLKASGVVPEIYASAWATDGYLAGTDQERAEALLTALSSGSPLVWAARGGYGAMRLLPLLEAELPEQTHEQVFLGFSDLTALFPLLTRRGYRCIHGPVLSQAGSLVEGGDAGFRALRRTLQNQASARRVRFRGLVPKTHGSVTGRLVGGNLTLCASMAGTRFEPDYDGAIFFIEDVGEPAYRLDRCLTQLELAGVFERVRCLLVGDLGVRGMQARLALRCLRRLCDKWSIPLVTGLPVGHGRRNACLGYGASVKIEFGLPDDSGRGSCVLSEIQ